MDTFELKPESPKNRRRNIILNILTVLVLLGTCCLLSYFLMLFFNPASQLNPFPPVMLPTRFSTATPTRTPIPLPSTWTPTATLEPSPSRTRAATWTYAVTQPPVLVTHTPSAPTIPSTPMPVTAKVTYVPVTDIHPNNNCNWLGIGGKVLGKDGKPLTEIYQIQVGGILQDQPVNLLAQSGTATAYGTSGFELMLGTHTAASHQTLWILLLDSTNKAMTDRIYFDTYTDCSKNLVMVVFTKNR